LEVRKVAPGYTVTFAPETVSVELEGPRMHNGSVVPDSEDITAYVSMAGKSAGRHSVPVIVKLPNGLSGLVTAAAIPKNVEITLVRKEDRTMDVGMQFIGSPPVGYRFGLPVFTPGKVVVSGKSELVGKVAQVVVMIDSATSDPQNIDTDLSVVPLDKTGKAVEGVEITPGKVHLCLGLLEAPASRAVFVGVDTVGRPPYPNEVRKIEITPQTITVTGKPEQLMDTTTIRTEPVQLSNRTKSFIQRVKVIAPSGLGIRGDSHVRVQVEIESKTPNPEPPKSN